MYDKRTTRKENKAIDRFKICLNCPVADSKAVVEHKKLRVYDLTVDRMSTVTFCIKNTIDLLLKYMLVFN